MTRWTGKQEEAWACRRCGVSAQGSRKFVRSAIKNHDAKVKSLVLHYIPDQDEYRGDEV